MNSDEAITSVYRESTLWWFEREWSIIAIGFGPRGRSLRSDGGGGLLEKKSSAGASLGLGKTSGCQLKEPTIRTQWVGEDRQTSRHSPTSAAVREQGLSRGSGEYVRTLLYSR